MFAEPTVTEIEEVVGLVHRRGVSVVRQVSEVGKENEPAPET